MRHYRSLIMGAGLLIFATPNLPAQIRNPGDLDPSGRVLAKIKVAMTEVSGFSHPVASLVIVIIAETGDQTSVRTDDAGIATAWLAPGTYQFRTPEPLSWNGVAYTWELTTAIQPGTAMIRFTPVNAQTTAPPAGAAAPSPPIVAGLPAPSMESQKLRVFTDCLAEGCDLNYFRTVISFVDYMRDRADASLHILVTGEGTGGGGTTYTIDFIGLRDLAGLRDTLRYVAPQSASSDDKRTGLARAIKFGLARYVSRSSAADQLEINFAPRAAAAVVRGPVRDPWNLWVFQMNANANLSGEKSQSFTSLRGSINANRTSEAWKFLIGGTGGYNESKFTFSDGSKFNSYTHSYGGSQILVKSLGSHWSAGERSTLRSSTYVNQKLFTRFAPAIEFNVFPYSESTHRQLTFQYSVGVSSFRYQDTTIFNKISEVRPDNSLVAALDFKEPWGSVSLSLDGASYLDDMRKHRAVLDNSFDVRVFKGFSVNFYAEASLLRDQLYIAKGTLSDADILVRKRQLASTFSYYLGIGLSYTFGSIFNNIVNPRFNLAGGG
ncbi:MAG: hypothetical protein ABJC63_12360 [Gemmatimonadales bacterium]